ncbi:tetratricopeptide repeat protein [Scopulibacillus darangshiensis]|uniref:Tetratricopeptide repeat protein n=1 Tax=Scopulibacillus darangshiensis TaxID=442528 RepID=A0A4R2NQY3_9BACL|nr:helix-turn-helix domain-containing protein [Scopulibacillus darangshiensis]TCP23814.1 tetratricopeptide repeat protein [Scopulibacillus darangshiensis]
MIGTRIRYYRKRSGLTLEQLADGICSVSYLSKFEHGEKASDEIIKFLCDRLGISFEDVDNHEEIAEINRLLDEWYESIRDRNPDDMAEKEQAVTEKINTTEDPFLLIKYELFKVRLLLIDHKSDEAKPMLANIEKFKEIFTPELQYLYYHFKGVYFYTLENYNEALRLYQHAEELLIQLNYNEKEAAELYYQISLTHTDFYHISQGINYAHKALELFEKSYNLKRIADCQTLLGISSRRIFNYDQAEFHYTQALKFAELYKDDIRKGILYHNLGYVQSFLGNSKIAIDYYKKGLILRETFDPKSKCLTLFLLAREHFKINDTEKAQSFIQEGLKMSKQNNLSDSYYKFKILDLKINNKNEEYEELLRKKAIPYFSKVKLWEHVSEYAEELANYCYDIGKYKRAGHYFRLAIGARNELH